MYSTHSFRLRELLLLLLREGTELARRPDDICDCRHLARPDADACGVSDGRRTTNNEQRATVAITMSGSQQQQ